MDTVTAVRAMVTVMDMGTRIEVSGSFYSNKIFTNKAYLRGELLTKGINKQTKNIKLNISHRHLRQTSILHLQLMAAADAVVVA